MSLRQALLRNLLHLRRLFRCLRAGGALRRREFWGRQGFLCRRLLCFGAWLPELGLEGNVLRLASLLLLWLLRPMPWIWLPLLLQLLLLGLVGLLLLISEGVFWPVQAPHKQRRELARPRSLQPRHGTALSGCLRPIRTILASHRTLVQPTARKHLAKVNWGANWSITAARITILGAMQKPQQKHTTKTRLLNTIPS